MTAVLADATNLGLSRMARSSGAFSHSRLLWVAEWHVRDETYQAALACLVDAIHTQPFSKIWGDGDTSSSDGQFFRAGGHGEARADYNAKYGSEPPAGHRTPVDARKKTRIIRERGPIIYRTSCDSDGTLHRVDLENHAALASYWTWYTAPSHKSLSPLVFRRPPAC